MADARYNRMCDCGDAFCTGCDDADVEYNDPGRGPGLFEMYADAMRGDNDFSPETGLHNIQP